MVFRLFFTFFVYILLNLHMVHALETCPNDGNPGPDDVWHNCIGSYTDENGHAYTGEWKNSTRYGQGTIIFAGGDKYVGDWKNNAKHGTGTYTFTNGDKYVGEMKDDVFHGQGTAYFADGSVWVGQFSNGNWAQGEQYAAGEVPPDVIDKTKKGSLGVMIQAVTNDIATSLGLEKTMGALVAEIIPGSPAEKSGMQVGDIIIKYGDKAVDEHLTLSKIISEIDKYKLTQVEVWRNGGSAILQIVLIPTEEDSPDVIAETDKTESSVAEGKSGSDTCLDNEIWDNCVASYTDDSGVYNGEWKNNLPHGKGTHTYTNGAKYVGEFKDGKIHGQGILTYSEGGKDVGEFKDGRLHGQGTAFFTDGRMWIGQWNNSKWVEGQKFAAGDSAIDLIKAGADVCLNTDEVWDNCVGERTEEDIGTYTGEFKDDKFHGKGTMTYISGQKYVGEWKDDKFHGKGTYIWAGKWSGQKYVGEFKDDKFHGKGTMTYISGDKYLGEWKDSKRDGEGTYTFSSGTQYVGEWKDGVEHGEAVKTFADGRVWIGIFRDGNWVSGRQHAAGEVSLDVVDNETSETESSKDGLCLSSAKVWNGCVGKMSSEDGMYNGEWKNNLPHGKGTYAYDMNNPWKEYVGNFVAGKHSGQGTLTYKDYDGRVKYVGEWKDGRKDGQGTETHNNGTIYVGEWRNDYNHGQGTMSYADGSEYVGNFEEGWIKGQGTYTSTSGDKYVGEFNNGNFNGQGTYTFVNGDEYVGSFAKGRYDGQGTLTLADGTKKTGDFLNGRFIGDGYPLKIKGIALGDKTAPCSPEEYIYSDTIFNKPIRTALECFSGNSKDEINIIFSLDGSSIVRVKRKQYLGQSDPEPEEILEAAVGFYGTPTERDEGNWLALYDNAHSIEYDGEAAYASMNEDGIGLLIKGFICADGKYGTKNCEGLGIYLIEYDLVDVDMYNKQVEDGKLKMEKIQKEKITNQEF